MKRSTLVDNLIKEGMSEKTLVRFTDKQLSDLHERIVTTTQAMASNPEIQKLADDPNKTVEVKETLKGGQKKLDKNHNGKIDGQDFKILKGQKQSEVKEAFKPKSDENVSRKDWKHFNADGEELKNEPRMKGGYSIDNEGKRHESRGNQEVKKPSEVKEWVEKLVENKYHSFTSKNEIMELISFKLNESDTMVQHGSKVKKGRNGVPEFMTYYSMVDAAEPKTAPTTKPSPTREPGTKPTPNKDPRKTPFRPGPGPNPKPKALKENKKSK